MKPPPASTPAPTPSGDRDLVGRDVGPYRVESRLGAGGMGVVYRANDTRLGRAVALKVLAPALHADPRARERLHHEARTVATLDHPNVVAIYDVGETDDGGFYIAMAYYDGETLDARLAQGALGPGEAIALAGQIADGLGAAHRAGIVHRDVKPANVLLAHERGTVGEALRARVLDFGIARTDDVALTRTGETMGTALYMSPEQLRGEPVDARTDVWALGVVLYEMLAGRRPFTGLYAAALGFAILHEEPPPLGRGDLPDGLEAIVQRCLAKEPAARYASMDDLAADLRRIADGDGPAPRTRSTGARATVEGPRLRSRLRSRLVPWVAAGLAVAAIALGVIAWPALRPAAAQEQRLVVLPFRATGPDAEALADGLLEATTGALATMEALRERVSVVPASEVEPGMTPSQAHDRLGATLVVEGRVATEAGGVRVTLTLVEVDDSGARQGASRQIDGTSGSTFALQDAAALEVADLLRIQVGAEARQALAAGGTDDPDANARYLRARGLLRNQQSVDDLDRVRALFAEALAIDPDFALAHAGLAEAEWQTFNRTDDAVWAQRALVSGRRALALDDGLAGVHVAMAVVYQGRGELGEALASVDRALDLDDASQEAHRRRAKILADLGRTSEAEQAFRRAVALAPDFWRTHNSLGVFFLESGRAAEAEAQFQLALTLSPANLSLLGNLGVAAWLEGDFATSARAHEEVLRLDPENANAAYNLSNVQAFLGHHDEAVAAAERVVARQPDSYAAHAALAMARWWAPGQRDRARAELPTVLRLGRQTLAVGRDPQVLVEMAHVFAMAGQTDSARVYLRELESLLPPEGADVQLAFVVGTAYQMAGERARALAWIGRALANGYGAAQLERSPWLADLREDPLVATLPSP